MARRPGKPSTPKVSAEPEAAVPGGLVLAETLDLNAAGPLAKELLALRNSNVAIDASAVHHLGAQCGQVLASALNTWANDGYALTFVSPSEGFEQGSRLLGFQAIFQNERSPS